MEFLKSVGLDLYENQFKHWWDFLIEFLKGVGLDLTANLFTQWYSLLIVILLSFPMLKVIGKKLLVEGDDKWFLWRRYDPRAKLQSKSGMRARSIPVLICFLLLIGIAWYWGGRRTETMRRLRRWKWDLSFSLEPALLSTRSRFSFYGGVKDFLT